MQLRDYLYLDLKRLEDYLSILDPGEIKDLRQIIRDETGDVGTSTLAALGQPPLPSTDHRREEITVERPFRLPAA